jgi:hypothetical protein
LQEFQWKDGCWLYGGDAEPEPRGRGVFSRKEIAFKVTEVDGRFFAWLVHWVRAGRTGRTEDEEMVGCDKGYVSEGAAEQALETVRESLLRDR